MATVKKLDGLVRDGKQAYVVRWNIYEPVEQRWKPREKRVYGLSEANAHAAKMQAAHEGARAAEHEDARLTFGVAVERWLRTYATVPRRKKGKAARVVQQTSWDNAAVTLDFLLDRFGEDTLLRDITARELTKSVEERTRREYVGTDETGERIYDWSENAAAEGTKARMVGTLKAFFSDALSEGWIPADPTAKMPAGYTAGKRAIVPSLRALQAVAAELDVETRTRRTRWGGTSERVVYNGASEGWLASDRLWLLAYTGMGISEARGLRVGDDRGSYLALARVWRRNEPAPEEHGKAESRIPREVPIPAVLRPSLDRLAAYSKDGYLFTGPDGTVYSYESWRNALDRAATAADVALTSHELRHFAASLWIASGASAFIVMKAGGWSSLDMVSKVYAHLWPTDAAALAAAIDRLDMSTLEQEPSDFT